MASLERLEACGFDISEAHTIEYLREQSAEKLLSLLIPTERLFEDLVKVHLPEFYEKLFRSGCEIYQKKISTAIPEGSRVRVMGKKGFFALGEVMPAESCREHELGSAIKSIKLFDI